ncbi:cation:proton antiporter [Acetobacterium wieringae]|uniref:Na(+)/H(+) antiporter NhaP n=1 Tax=Acetobacterium wieringae TaxID=52694 RepID=A0A1F2PCR5_9FIRM|nr:cation:proton antiporter [Acetobacterium wieringae]OFV69033.1 Na(+)/H(+) antiporter NhaP [Acetobacterium wieringae]
MYNFNELLILFTVVLFLVVVFSFINEKTIKLPYEIGLVVFGFGFCLILILLQQLHALTLPEELLDLVKQFNFNDFLIHGVLCFMLFSGASRIKFNDFDEDKFLIGRMAIIGTMVSILIYGSLFYGLAYLFQLNMSFLEALILGSIVSPSDPISAMSILSKVGLPHRLSLIIEGESLFNDGVAVAIFATLMSILEQTGTELTLVSFVWGLFADILGAVAVGLIVALLLSVVFKQTKNRYIKIFTSILTVMTAYLICEYLGFSGPIAAVICGLFYATGIARLQKRGMDEEIQEIHDLFYDFWGVIDNLLNGVLFLLVGLLFVDIRNLEGFSNVGILIILIGSILINTIARTAGVFGNVVFVKNLPLKMSKFSFTVFFTWAGLKGGLCLALVMGTGTSLAADTYSIFLIATYAIVLFTTVFQGLTVGKAYERLK